jgi:hypothetical protein
MPYNKEQQKQYNKDYRKDKPKSAISQYYQFYKFLITLTDEELTVLYKKRRTDLKYANESERERLKTEMKIITDLYAQRKEETFINNE